VQSSSAVTVATIGFVNAGLLSLYQAVGIILGTNIGTTMTGWLVAIIGFKINVEVFALPMIGLGMLLRLFSGATRFGYIGVALTGFGLFFIGIDVLTEAFEHITASINLQSFATDNYISIIIFVGIGAFMTILTQSSSAAIALTLTAATGGVLGLSAAAAMVIGANVGTTSTAALAVIGATPNAKRVAAAHIIFNVVTAIIALLLLPILLLMIGKLSDYFGINQAPAISLALFHTFFNIFGVILIWPIAAKLTSYLEKRFVSKDEIEGQPQYLDKNIVTSPSLAINAALLELIRISSFVRRLAKLSLTRTKVGNQIIKKDQASVIKLCNSTSEFMNLLSRKTFSEEVSKQISMILRIEQHLLSTMNRSVELVEHQLESQDESIPAIDLQIKQLQDEVVKLLNESDLEKTGFDIQLCEACIANIEKKHDELKNTLLNINNIHLPIQRIIDILERIKLMRAIARQYIKSTHYLNDLSQQINTVEVNVDNTEHVSLS
jgi:phosphate:Na+ symporter